jgi:hypothetical protein
VYFEQYTKFIIEKIKVCTKEELVDMRAMLLAIEGLQANIERDMANAELARSELPQAIGPED